MKYRYQIEIKAVVNSSTCAAELYVVNEEYDGFGKGIVVHQKHIGNFPTYGQAEDEAGKYCENLRKELEKHVKMLTKNLPAAKP